MCVCVFVFVYVCMYVCMYVCALYTNVVLLPCHTHTLSHTHTHTHTHITGSADTGVLPEDI